MRHVITPVTRHGGNCFDVWNDSGKVVFQSSLTQPTELAAIQLGKTYMKLFQLRYPRLYELVMDGTVYLVNDEWCGKASDGVEVGLGMIDRESQIESYLAEHPTPDTW